MPIESHFAMIQLEKDDGPVIIEYVSSKALLSSDLCSYALMYKPEFLL